MGVYFNVESIPYEEDSVSNRIKALGLVELEIDEDDAFPTIDSLASYNIFSFFEKFAGGPDNNPFGYCYLRSYQMHFYIFADDSDGEPNTVSKTNTGKERHLLFEPQPILKTIEQILLSLDSFKSDNYIDSDRKDKSQETFLLKFHALLKKAVQENLLIKTWVA